MDSALPFLSSYFSPKLTSPILWTTANCSVRWTLFDRDVNSVVERKEVGRDQAKGSEKERCQWWIRDLMEDRDGLLELVPGFSVRRNGTLRRGGRNPAPLFLADSGGVLAYVPVEAEDVRLLVQAFDGCCSPCCVALSY